MHDGGYMCLTETEGTKSLPQSAPFFRGGAYRCVKVVQVYVRVAVSQQHQSAELRLYFVQRARRGGEREY